MRRWFPGIALALAAALILLPSCGERPEPEGGGARPLVMTTFYPTQYFAERIGGDLVRVVCPVPADRDAAFWMPDAPTIRRYQQADLIVLNGAQFEKWVGKTSLPEAKVVDTAKPFEKEFLRFRNAITHSHGKAGQHSHVGIDGHTWLDPRNAKVQAGEIAKALERLLPAHAEEIRAGLEALGRDLDTLDAELTRLSRDYDGHPILASHPAYNYLARRYGWTVVNLHLDPAEMPGEATFASIRDLLAKKPAKHILWEAEPLPGIASRFREELGLRSVVFSPTELLSEEALAAGHDYLSSMRENLARLAPVLANR